MPAILEYLPYRRRDFTRGRDNRTHPRFAGAGYAVVTGAITETLPANVRVSGVSLAYNICLGLFGGTAPLLATYLVNRTGDDFAPAYYLMAAAVLSFLALIGLPEMAKKPLPT